MSPTVDVDPVHNCEYSHFKAQLFRDLEFLVYDLLNAVAVLEFWNGIRLPSQKWRSEGCMWLKLGVSVVYLCTLCDSLKNYVLMILLEKKSCSETPFAIKQYTEAEANALPVMNLDVKPPVTRTN